MRRRLSSILAATAMLAMSAQAVSADALLADGDGLSPVSGVRMNLGTICHAETRVATALVAVRATGHPNGGQVFENGSTVKMSATVLSGAGMAVTSAGPAIVLPRDWRSQPNQTVSAPVSWDVSVTPNTLVRYAGRLEFLAEGLNRRGQAVTRVVRMNVVARVVDCTPPVLADLPADLVFEADGPDGANVVYVPPTATDAVDGPVAVDCDVPSSSRLPIGVTTVTCSATDAARNSTSGTFDVTVSDTTAPVLDGIPTGMAVTASEASGATVDWPTPTASDAVSGPLLVTCDPAPGSLFAVGSTTVDCSATDSAGNVATASFVVDVAAPPPPDPLPEEPPVETPSTPAEPEPSQPDREETAAGGSSPAATPTTALSPTPPAGAVLPNTSTTPADAAATMLGLLLVALAVAVPAARRRRA